MMWWSIDTSAICPNPVIKTVRQPGVEANPLDRPYCCSILIDVSGCWDCNGNCRPTAGSFLFFNAIETKMLMFRCKTVCLLVGLLAAYTIWPSGDGRCSAQDASAELIQARQDLQLSIQTHQRIAAEMERLQADGQTSPQVLHLYQVYLERVHKMVQLNQRMLTALESSSGYVGSSSGPVDHTQSNPVQISPPTADAYDKLAPLQRQFNASLADFDEMLLKHQHHADQQLDQIRAETSDKLQALAQEAASATEQLRAQGVEVETRPPSTGSGQDSTAQGQQGEGEQAERRPGIQGSGKGLSDGENEPARTGRQSPSASGWSRGDGSSQPEQPATVAHDDDIVARQLREAAEQETDPELKAKLWKEYKRYKYGNPQAPQDQTDAN